MAEDEIIKHTKAIYKTAGDKDKKWEHKFKEIFVEIVIIVFAVSISIWLHNWSDAQKDKKEEKVFLNGLKSDLKTDADNLAGSRNFYEAELSGINYFIAVAAGQNLAPDSLLKYNAIFSASTNLEANTSWYTALKGSGKFNIIENTELLKNIIEVHEVLFSHVQLLDNIFNDYNTNKTEPFVFDHLQLDAGFQVTNAEQVIRSSQMKFYLLRLQGLIKQNIIPFHSKAIEKCNAVITQIDEEIK